MNKIIIFSALLTLTACSSGKFTASESAPKPVSNELTGTICDADNADPVSCDVEGCSEKGSQYCEAGKWGLCECEQSGESGGSTFITGGSTGGSTGGATGGSGSGGATGGATGGDTGGTSESGGSGGAICIPKTCEEYSVEKTGTTNRACGLIDDGCGGKIVCENTLCDTSNEYVCGESLDPYFTEVDSGFDPANYPDLLYGNDPNICYGGKVRILGAFTCQNIAEDLGYSSFSADVWITAAYDDKDILLADIQEEQSKFGSKICEQPFTLSKEHVTCCFSP